MCPTGCRSTPEWQRERPHLRAESKPVARAKSPPAGVRRSFFPGSGHPFPERSPVTLVAGPRFGKPALMCRFGLRRFHTPNIGYRGWVQRGASRRGSLPSLNGVRNTPAVAGVSSLAPCIAINNTRPNNTVTKQKDGSSMTLRGPAAPEEKKAVLPRGFYAL